MHIRITEDIEYGLKDQARREGKTPEALALDALRARFAKMEETETGATKPRTLADRLAKHIGVISSSEHVEGGAQMSKDVGKKFAEGMAEKREQGKL